MARDEMLGHTQLTPHTAHLVFEQPLQGLAQLQVHLLGQAAHIVVALDNLARNVERLDTVGIDGTLGQPLGIGNLLGLGIEHLYEISADDLALLLRVCNTRQIGKELA